VLALGQTLRHEFTVENTSDRPLRFLAARALTPCCSAIGPLPDSIPPGGAAALPVSLKVGNRAERKQVRFEVGVATDVECLQSYDLAAEILPEVEFHAVEGPPELSIHQGGRQVFRIVSRKIGAEGRGVATAVEASPPSLARFLGEPTLRKLAGGVTEAVQVVEVTAEGSEVVGDRRDLVKVRWDGAVVEPYPVVWRIRPRVVAVPAGLILDDVGPGVTRSILLKATDRPFRVLGVKNPLARDRPGTWRSEPATTHRVEFDFDRDEAPSGVSTLTITTDHPDQPEIALSVFIPSPVEARP
jgi:hypothetical protein